jgi:oligopeptide transport system permease protein
LKQIVGKVIFFLIICVCLILIALFPREATVTAEGRAATVVYKYEFSWGKYKEILSSFIHGIIHNQTFGETRYHKPVEAELLIYFPRSLKIIISAFFLSLAVGILKGIYDFRKTNKRTNIIGNGTTWLLLSIPDFFLILVVQWVIIYYFNWIDIFGHEYWYNFFIPSLLVSVYPAMYISRITSAAVAGEAAQQYVQVAKSKGLHQDKIISKHILKNCAGRILSNTPSMIIYILSNLLFVEYLLDYKGAAYRLWLALDFEPRIFVGRDTLYEPSVIIGFGICFMAIVLAVQIISQLVSARIDPR